MLSVNVPKRIRARKVQLAFVGKEHTRVTRGSGDDEQVYTEDNIIVKDVVDVWTATQGGYLGPCNEIYPFEFQLPEKALLSIVAKNSRENYIAYEIKAKIDRPHTLDNNAESSFPVMYPLINNVPTKAVVKTFHAPTGRMHLEVSVDKNVYIPGETVSGRVKFKKDPSMNARAVECAVLLIESMTAEGVTDSTSYAEGRIHWDIDPSGEYYEWPFSIPTQKGGNYSVPGKLLKRQWVVDVKVDLPLKRDPHVEVPLSFLRLGAPETPK